MPIYFKTAGIREAPVNDALGEYPVRREWIHECRGRMDALVPKHRINLTRFHGVFAPNSKHRVDVTPAKRGKGAKPHERDGNTPQQRHRAMRWAQRLKPVFNIDVSTCEKCTGEAKIITRIEDQAVIDKILHHLQAKGTLEQPSELLPPARASPESNWFS